MELKSLSSNWKKLQGTLKKKDVSATTTAPSTKRKRSDREPQKNNAVKKPRVVAEGTGKRSSKTEFAPRNRKTMSQGVTNGGVEDVAASEGVVKAAASRVNEGRAPSVEIGKYVAIDCEMVGIGPNPDNDSALARVSIVDYNGDQVYDSYVRPKEMVTDWRTHVSGIAPKHMIDARSLEQVQKEVAEILDGRILVGHALRNDLDALLLSHPKRDIRDTSKHPPYRKFAGGGSPRLKILASELLGLQIQDGAHSSVEDARATMMLYRKDKDEFEREHLKKWPVRVVVENKEKGEGDKKKKKKKKKTRKR
ncbi:RNA exonuclease 4 [Aspergillus granulosus]|uniref:RNA exonuclease 4 n=1 Tax=Aspergillus granulosus TaxID=176169 RepID=A0ABR4HPH1_9EURO